MGVSGGDKEGLRFLFAHELWQNLPVNQGAKLKKPFARG